MKVYTIIEIYNINYLYSRLIYFQLKQIKMAYHIYIYIYISETSLSIEPLQKKLIEGGVTEELEMARIMKDYGQHSIVWGQCPLVVRYN